MSDFLQTLVLAVVQGVTEFLPISSTAHLHLFPLLFGWADRGQIFDIAANTGTLLAVLALFRHQLFFWARAFFVPSQRAPAIRLLSWLVVATLPVAAVGFFASVWLATLATNPAVLGAACLIFGVLLGLADRRAATNRRVLPELEIAVPSSGLAGLDDLSWVGGLRWSDAVILGLFQALALVPGTSRSGITMTAALFRGFGRAAAARVAFLLAIPVGGAVAAKQALDLLSGEIATGELPSLAVAMVVSGLAGWLVMVWLIRFLQRRSMMGFVAYRLVLGALLVALAVGAV